MAFRSFWPLPSGAFAIGIGTALLLASVFWSVSVGAAGIDLLTVWQAVVAFDPAISQHLIIQDFRLPRVVAAAAVGGALGMAGAIMQGLTSNPLASPSLMGLNAGASLALVLGIAFLPWLPFTGLIALSCLGAAAGVSLVFAVGLARRGGLAPLRLALAGAAVTALLGAVTTGITLVTGIAQDLLFYSAGGVQGVRWAQLAVVLPWMGAGAVLALALSRDISVLSLGGDIAAGLGQRTRLIRSGAILATLCLAGCAVSVAGNVGFVGLVAPHVARFFVGLDYRVIIPMGGILGALLVTLADLAARMVNPPYETPLGLLTALIGVPFFLWLVRRDKRGM